MSESNPQSVAKTTIRLAESWAEENPADVRFVRSGLAMLSFSITSGIAFGVPIILAVIAHLVGYEVPEILKALGLLAFTTWLFPLYICLAVGPIYCLPIARVSGTQSVLWVVVLSVPVTLLYLVGSTIAMILGGTIYPAVYLPGIAIAIAGLACFIYFQRGLTRYLHRTDLDRYVVQAFGWGAFTLLTLGLGVVCHLTGAIPPRFRYLPAAILLLITLVPMASLARSLRQTITTLQRRVPGSSPPNS